MKKEVTTSYLQMVDVSEFRPKEGFEKKVEIKEMANDAFLNFIMFAGVGLPFRWYSRLKWPILEWEAYFANNQVKTFLGFRDNQLIGYYEIEVQDKNAEIKFFGLLPGFIGKGLGGWFLSHAISCAWETGVERVWLHTCTSDHKAALASYVSRGFKVYQKKTEMEINPENTELVQLVAGFFENYLDKFTHNQM